MSSGLVTAIRPGAVGSSQHQLRNETNLSATRRLPHVEPTASPMTATALQPQPVIDWSVSSRALPGQSISGDLSAVIPWTDGVLIAAIDGLGHGEDATAAARLAVSALERHANEPVIMIVQHCHRALQRSRGVAMTVIALNTRDDTLTALGIGNVETVIVRANPYSQPRRESVLLRNGVVGYQLPELHVSVFAIAAGDVVVFATDGIREDFSDLINVAEPPQQLASRILAQKFRGTDDGLVLVCKYLGKP
jgi:negative regulator of sigma-B (phosphoserine phosphatase)